VFFCFPIIAPAGARPPGPMRSQQRRPAPSAVPRQHLGFSRDGEEEPCISSVAPLLLYGVTSGHGGNLRPSTLVFLQNGIFHHHHRYSLLHILFFYTHLPLNLSFIPTTSEWGPPCRFLHPYRPLPPFILSPPSPSSLPPPAL
jgi:hypothetical protein